MILGLHIVGLVVEVVFGVIVLVAAAARTPGVFGQGPPCGVARLVGDDGDEVSAEVVWLLGGLRVMMMRSPSARVILPRAT